MRYLLLFMLSLATFTAPRARAEAPPSSLTVLADPGLALPLTRIARDYTHQQHVAVTIVLTDRSDIVQQISQGMDASLLVTADRALLEALNQQGLNDTTSTRSVARTQLALATPIAELEASDLAKHISFSAILYAKPRAPLYVMPAATLEGALTQRLLQSAAYSDAFATRSVTAEDRPAIRQHLSHAFGFALLPAPDILQDPALKLLTVLPDDAVEPITYQASLIASESMDPARAFMHYLQSPPAQTAFAHYGFQPPNSTADAQ